LPSDPPAVESYRHPWDRPGKVRSLNNQRSYGAPPFTMAVIHGGPGASGEMAPVARELARVWGVLEPLQTARSVEGQIEELRDVLTQRGDLPLTLIGHSWGAWLSYMLAARFPACVRKLILVGCGPFTEEYAAAVQATRLSRLSAGERTEFDSILRGLEEPGTRAKAELLARLGRLTSKTDQYHPVQEAGASDQLGSLDGDLFREVWREAAELRRTGRLLELAQGITCPVTAIHGDYDPHPAQGVREPLSSRLSQFRFVLLEKCGHSPWAEEEARDRFYQVLREELQA